jgi:hypothetical protein
MVHSFTVFGGGWPPFEGFVPCEMYKWLSRLSYSFLLETFTFVSGYVYAFQKYDLHKEDNLKKLVVKKVQRLLFPSVVFSILYAQLINGDNLLNGDSFGSTLIKLLSGIGHMWYLPILFWCFVFVFFVNKLNLNTKFLLGLFVVFAVLPLPNLPFRLSQLPYFFFFFYLGKVYWLNRGKFFSNLTLQKILSLWLLFAVMFVGLRTLKANVTEISEGNIWVVQKGILIVVSKACQLFYAFFGLTAIYATGLFVTSKYKLSGWYISLGNLCFGVYIYQEFILKYLYYFSELPQNCHPLVLPWMGFIISIIFSLCLAKATKDL